VYLQKEVDVVQSFKPQSILEFGIGDGRFARAYLTSNPGTYYVGVDNAEEMLNLAQDSGATLICSDFVDYLAKVISEGERFGCIVAPYTAIHHVKTSTQLELFEMMKQVADVLIINCLTTEAEKIFNEKDETEVTVQLPDGCTITTTVYLLHRKIRAQTVAVPESTHREFLVFKK
jgi:SAM-dependent methyltransferase